MKGISAPCLLKPGSALADRVESADAVRNPSPEMRWKWRDCFFFLSLFLQSLDLVVVVLSILLSRPHESLMSLYHHDFAYNVKKISRADGTASWWLNNVNTIRFTPYMPITPSLPSTAIKTPLSSFIKPLIPSPQKSGRTQNTITPESTSPTPKTHQRFTTQYEQGIRSPGSLFSKVIASPTWNKKMNVLWKSIT